ncbi:hypothetical protein SAMN05421880_11770 [Nitrosomonas nitrosa]|uniref:Uncharacterized protein n=1 Tax=Nitrosomonas nitrosa TaxID=52442 RepID=A0A1I4R5P8_9PROT|nr:hypothetical protein SAMN05421880_11770 [Nitrosomonas nitrosa]
MPAPVQQNSASEIIASPLAPGHWIAPCQCGGTLIIHEGVDGLIGRCQNNCGRGDRKNFREVA